MELDFRVTIKTITPLSHTQLYSFMKHCLCVTNLSNTGGDICKEDDGGVVEKEMEVLKRREQMSQNDIIAFGLSLPNTLPFTLPSCQSHPPPGVLLTCTYTDTCTSTNTQEVKHIY